MCQRRCRIPQEKTKREKNISRIFVPAALAVEFPAYNLNFCHRSGNNIVETAFKRVDKGDKDCSPDTEDDCGDPHAFHAEQCIQVPDGKRGKISRLETGERFEAVIEDAGPDDNQANPAMTVTAIETR